MKFGKVSGVFFVMFAASLWALDALIRVPLTTHIPPAAIVLFEHIVGIIVLSPFFLQSIPSLEKITLKNIGLLIAVSGVSSVGGTLLFTEALTRSAVTYDFISPLLIQKLQPIMVIGLSMIFLKERPQKNFFIWAMLALFGSYLMSFGLLLPQFEFATKLTVYLLALAAAACWGGGTILSKKLLKQFSEIEATFSRFLLAIPISFVIMLLSGQQFSLSKLAFGDGLRFILIALTTGAFALIIYYKGLKSTPAHVATIAELSFPFISVIIGLTALNPYGAPQQLTIIQAIGIALLLGSMYQLSKKE